ncbi:unnamed protein product, partial [Rotaria socialis]
MNSSISVPTTGLGKSTELLLNYLKEIGYAQISLSASIAYDRFAILYQIHIQVESLPKNFRAELFSEEPFWDRVDNKPTNLSVLKLQVGSTE